MLGKNSYDTSYVNDCRDAIGRRIAAFDQLPEGPERDAFEPVCFGDLVVLLEMQFVHRLRGQEGKDGNALNEVRVLVQSMLSGGTLTADKTIKQAPTITGLAYGDPVVVSREAFLRLSDAFFDEIEAKFPPQ